jgi:hypothetical protein
MRDIRAFGPNRRACTRLRVILAAIRRRLTSSGPTIFENCGDRHRNSRDQFNGCAAGYSNNRTHSEDLTTDRLLPQFVMDSETEWLKIFSHAQLPSQHINVGRWNVGPFQVCGRRKHAEKTAAVRVRRNPGRIIHFGDVDSGQVAKYRGTGPHDWTSCRAPGVAAAVNADIEAAQLPVGGDKRALRAAVAAYLGRYRAESRVHTGSDLKVFLIWCAGQEQDPLSLYRAEVERYVRWLQEDRRYQPSTVSRRLSIVVGAAYHHASIANPTDGGPSRLGIGCHSCRRPAAGPPLPHLPPSVCAAHREQ